MRRLGRVTPFLALVAIAPLACAEESSAPDLTYTPAQDEALAAAIYGRWEQASEHGARVVVLCEDEGASYCQGRDLCHDYRGGGRGLPETMPSSRGGCDGPGASAGARVRAVITVGGEVFEARGTLARSWAVADTSPGPSATLSARGAYDGPFSITASTPVEDAGARAARPRATAYLHVDRDGMDGLLLVSGARVGDPPDRDPAPVRVPREGDGGGEGGEGGSGDAGHDAGAPPRFRKTAEASAVCPPP